MRGVAATKSPSLFREGIGEGFELYEGSTPPLAPPHKVAIAASLLAESTVATLRGGGYIEKLAHAAQT